MNSIHSRQSSVNFTRSRRAIVQPRFLLAMTAMASAVGGVSYLATAQTGPAPVKMTAGTSSSQVKTLADLPALVESYGQSRLLQSTATKTGSRSISNVGTGQSGFNLVETDLTPNSKSDDREPIYSPGGDYIAFASNGKDADGNGRIDSDAFNAEGKYHIWVMNRDGSNQRQVTGLSDDKTRNQRRPAWSPDANQLVYVDGDAGASELYVVEPFTDSDSTVTGTQVGAPTRRTFLNPNAGATLRSPAWSPSGQTIVFAADANLDNDAGDVGKSFNLFSISPTGSTDTIVRLTGGSQDPVSGSSATTPVNDLNPAFAVNSNVIYFSSNRTNSGVIADSNVRRIWRIFANGSGKVQVTDPLQRSNGTANDTDDFPTSSLNGNISERVAFQTNSYIDSSDVTHDLNIWSLPVSSTFPTPFVDTDPLVYVSNFSGNRLESRNVTTGANSSVVQGFNGLTNPEGVLVQGSYVYVSNRGNNQIARFDQQTGIAAPSNGNGNGFTGANSVPSPTDLISDGSYFYVGSGNGPAGALNTTAIYRFNSSGGAAGNNPGAAAPANAAFSSGDTVDPGKITNGTEGLTFSAGNNSKYIYVSAVSDAKVNVYLRSTGRYQKTIVSKGAGGLSVPTGLAFGPDLNGDTFPDLYVNSSGTDDVKAFAGPDPNNLDALVGTGSNVAAGTFIVDVVSDDDGNQTNLNAPEGIRFIQRDDGVYQLFVSSFQNLNVPDSATGSGDHINRYLLDPSKINPANPATLTATSAPSNFATRSVAPNDATFLTINGAQGLGYFDFNQLGYSTLASSTGRPAPTPTPVPSTIPIENPSSPDNNGSATIVTNVLSSPNNYKASGIAPASGTDNVGEDKAPDVEPAFSRTATSAQLAARLSFASTRRFAPLPSSNLPDANGNAPTASNPFGADSSGNGGTFDIWGTSTADTTPPALIPQAAGNQLYPVVAPGPQSPFFAPRTAETGLKAGGNVIVAVVLSELESGVNDTVGQSQIAARIYRAGTETFTSRITKVNEAVPVNVATEVGRPLEQSLVLQPYDDGPVSQGGHERQAGAVSGDGIYYCEGTAATPTNAGDFYIDIDVNDRAGNSFRYDNVWGFSTQTFQKQSVTTSLFVSDYTTGQKFPYTLSGNNDKRFVNEMSVESYYLSNPGGQVVDPTLTGTSVTNTFTNVDVWRILSRGPVPSTVIDSYRPRITQQISSDPTKDPTYTNKTRSVAVADGYIVWAAPFAANSFVGPGTITDATTQSNLTNFLDAGGRLFVTGRDVAYALSNGDSSSNDFLRNELGADFSGEIITNNIDLTGGRGNGFLAYESALGDDFYNLQIADRIPEPNNTDNLYTDAALTQDPYIGIGVETGIGTRIDTIDPTGKGTIPVYTVGGAVVGQKVEQTRTNGLQSRVVFFGFGLEAVNRRYRQPTTTDSRVALNARYEIANGLTRYFKTNSVKGSVINDKTNLPIPNFLVSIKSGNETFLARTDAAGNYAISGVPQGTYTVEPAFLLNGKLVTRNTTGAQTDPAGFFGGTAITFGISGGNTVTANLRPIPYTPGTISGRVVTSKGTPYDFKDDLVLDQKAVGLTVLLRSIKPTTSTKSGGRYAQLAKTNFNGNFTFSGVPAGIQLEVVFNPRIDDPTTTADEGDIPIESGLRANYAGPKTDVGRRVIPDARHLEPVVAPIGNTYVLNDPDPAKYPNPDTGPAAGTADSDKATDSGVPIVVPEGATVSGLVTLNGVPFKAAKVELFAVNGTTLTLKRTKSTTVTGTYSFPDVAAGTYRVRATARLSDGLEVTKDYPQFTLGTKDVTANIKLFLAKVSGLVTLNGKPTKDILVQLLDSKGKPIVRTGSDGKTFTLVRTAKTDSGTTVNYKLINVPAGNYIVRASIGGAIGTAAITVGSSKDVVAPTINLIPQKLSGVVNLRIDGVNKGGISGAQVELLDSTGKSFSPAITTTSGTGGAYNFQLISAGTYMVRATYKGDTYTSAAFVLKDGIDPRPTLTINLQTVTVTVLDTQGSKPVASVTVTLSKGSTILQTQTTNSVGQVKFTEVPAGTYVVTATKGDLSRTNANVVVTKGQPLSISLQLLINGGGGVTYAANKTFLVSLPYATDNTAGTISVDQAFGTSLSKFRLFRFNAAKQVNDLNRDLVPITSGSFLLKRGEGYVLQTLDTPVTTRTPNDNTALKGFAGTSFTIPLTWNNTYLSDTAAPDNRYNGFNLIGFPFDPSKFRAVSFIKARVMYGSKIYASVNDAAAAGIISPQLFTLNDQGVRVALSTTDLRPSVGYFVRILRNDQPVRLLLENPTS